jgi:hypothetical protein
MSDAEVKAAAAGVAVAQISGDSPTVKQRCLELLYVLLWGQDGAKNLNLKVSIVLGMEAIFATAVMLDMLCGGALKEHGIRCA